VKDFEWRKRFAPNGYAYVKQRVSFETVERAYSPKDVFDYTLESMHRKLAKDCPYFFDPLLAQTRITVFPKETGETINHLDPLKPRFGIEIEIRQPMPKGVSQC
jgi:hypothetical protein